MTKETSIKLFDQKQIRTLWHEDDEKWYFSIVDVVAVLTESPNSQVYWRVLKKRLKDEGNETVTNCNGLKSLKPAVAYFAYTSRFLLFKNDIKTLFNINYSSSYDLWHY
jgi:prophage antirepressor-like protein